MKCQLWRSPGVVVLAYIASTALVLMLLLYTIHIVFLENSEIEEEGQDMIEGQQLEKHMRVSDLLRASPPHTFPKFW